MARFELCILAILPCFGLCANILGIWFHAGKSHHILGEVLLKELARRGHNVTMASPFPLTELFPNYTDVHLTGILEDQLSRESMFMKMNEGHSLVGVPDVLELTRAQVELTLNHPEMTRLLNSKTKFDVIIMDWFLNEAILIYGTLFNAPIIPIASHGTSGLAARPVGSPLPPSYIPTLMMQFPNNMNFFQRVVNGGLTLILRIVHNNNEKIQEGILRKRFKDAPSIEELMNNVALVFSNGHYSYEPPRPFVPNLIPIGGFHVQGAKKLPVDLQKFMDDAKDGVIYFSLGSNMKSVLMPEAKQQEILKVFSKLPYKVIWKWEADHIANRPSNVLVRKWVPQNDILAHPNLKLFITHGGLLSTIESIHYGLPVLGIPIFGDQQNNIAIAVRSGYAVRLDLFDITEESLTKALDEVLNNPKYLETARKKSQILRDQPIPPLDTAVFWVEHVIRHKGASHLRNDGYKLTWYQYFLVDAYLFLTSILIAILAIIYYTIKKIIRLIVRNITKKKQD